MTHQHNRLLPLTYRAELLQLLLPRLFAGECCALIGTSGVGKSNLTRFVQRTEVQAAYGADERTWIVLIDSHRRLKGEYSPAYAIFEQIMHQVILEAERRNSPTELIAWATDLHSRAAERQSAHLAMRYLDRMCSRLCGQAQIQLILVFDQFEDLWVSLDAEFFLSLRSLRDQYKYQLVYLVLTRTPLKRLRTDLESVEAFWELFSPHSYSLGMYSPQDSQDMLERLALRAHIQLDAALQEHFLELSGRHPALLRALFWALAPAQDYAMDAEQIASLPSVAEECHKLWDDLSLTEQRLTRQLVKGRSPESDSTEILMDLRFKGLVSGEPAILFSPVFAAHVSQLANPDALGILVDLPSHTVFIEGQPLRERLPRLEFTLITYLARHTERICSRDELLDELYKDKALTTNDQRLDTVLSRLRRSLGEDARQPHYLLIHRGLGVQLRHATLSE